MRNLVSLLFFGNVMRNNKSRVVVLVDLLSHSPKSSDFHLHLTYSHYLTTFPSFCNKKWNLKKDHRVRSMNLF